ncbi:MAG: hypothetical protein V4508_07440 [Pseudomonadota bacterium]
MSERKDESFWVWKATICTVCFLLICVLVYCTFHSPSLLGPGIAGELAAKLSPEQELGSARNRIDALSLESPLARAGASVGDFIEFEQSVQQKKGILLAGEPIPLTLSGTKAVRLITVAASASAAPPKTTFQILLLVFASVGIVFALTIGFKRPESLACRALSLYFLGTALNVAHNVTTPGFAGIATWYLWAVSVPLIWTSLTIFAVYYPEDRPAGLRKRIQRMRMVNGTFMLGLGIFLTATLVQGKFFPYAQQIAAIVLLFNMLIILVALTEGWRSSKGEIRQRQLWMLASFGLLAILTEGTWIMPASLLQPYYLLNYFANLVCYAGLIYAVLRYRVFDFGFAINRALVYSLTSLVLLVAFGLTEWLSEHFLHFEGREQNVLLDGGIALGVYLAFHRVRHAVEHFIEQLFFHRWHTNEAALREFVTRAAHFISRDALLAAFGGELERFTCRAGYAIYQRDNASTSFVLRAHTLLEVPQNVDLDDGVAVCLRKEQVPTALSETASALMAELALPMAHRTELDGFILLGSKPNHESYRPDELDVLGFAAHQVGLDLHAAKVEQLEQHSSAIEHEMRVLRAQLQTAMRFRLGEQVPLPS